MNNTSTQPAHICSKSWCHNFQGDINGNNVTIVGKHTKGKNGTRPTVLAICEERNIRRHLEWGVRLKFYRDWSRAAIKTRSEGSKGNELVDSESDHQFNGDSDEDLDKETVSYQVWPSICKTYSETQRKSTAVHDPRNMPSARISIFVSFKIILREIDF